MRRLFLLASVLVFVVVACAPSPAEIESRGYDWCFTFDFTLGGNFYLNPSLSIPVGEWDDYGIVSTNGSLAVSYTHPTFVYPALITANVTFISADLQSSYILASMDVFGIEQNIESYITDESGEIGANATLGTNGKTANITVTTDTDHIMELASFTVYGFDVNPFAENHCASGGGGGGGGGGSATNTPISIPTATATATATATITPTASTTPFPSCHTIDLTNGTTGAGPGFNWEIQIPANWGSYVQGSGVYADTEYRPATGNYQHLIWTNIVFDTVLGNVNNLTFYGTTTNPLFIDCYEGSCGRLWLRNYDTFNTVYNETFYNAVGAGSWQFVVDAPNDISNGGGFSTSLESTSASTDVYVTALKVCFGSPILTSTPTLTATATPELNETDIAGTQAAGTAEMQMTLTAMPECVFQEYRDFRDSTQGFAVIQGDWMDGEGIKSETVNVGGNNLQRVHLYTTFTAPVYDMTYVIHFPEGIIASPISGENQIEVLDNATANLVLDYSDGIDPTIENVTKSLNGGVPGELVLKVSAKSFSTVVDAFGNPTIIQEPYYVRGVYINQFGQSPDCQPPPATATYTPTPNPTQVAATATGDYEQQLTATYTPTKTIAEACLFQNYSFNDGLSQWTYSGASAYPGAVILNNGAYIEQTVYSDGGYYLWVPATINDGAGDDTDGSATIYYQIERFSDNAIVGGGTITANEESFYAGGGNLYNFISDYIDMDPGFYTIQIQAQLASISTINALSACFTLIPPEQVVDDTQYPEDNFAWAECGDTISPPANLLNIGSWIRYLWSQLTKFFICSLEPILRGIWDAISGLFNLVGWLVGWLWQFLQNVWSFLWWLLTSAWELIVSVLGMLWDLVVYLVGQIWRVVSWALTALTQLFRLYDLWRDVEPVQPPGLPDCINAPTDSNICAVYYIAEHTFFSGTIGGLFIPVLLVYITLEMVSWVITRIIAIFSQTISTLIGGE